MPGGGHLTLRITRSEQSEQLLAAMVIETFICLGQQSPAAIEGIGLSATMSHRLVLHPPSALVELGVAQLHHMKWISHLDGIGNHRVKDCPIRTRQVERRVDDAVPPSLPSSLQPPAGCLATPTRNDIEELADLHVDELGRELLAMPRPDAAEEHLVQPECGHDTEAAGVIDERFE